MENEMSLLSELKKSIYCSKRVDTEEEKKKLFNALERCDALLNDCEGSEIEIEDIYIEEKQVDEEGSENRVKYRTILFDANGQTYVTGSYGIYNVLKKIIGIYGLPDSWENPLKVRVAKKSLMNGKKALTLILI